ncbi:MAG: B12-binding domain-containing radical SAM protein [Deltaproteobacteria bacterium]|nr:B12-binding domain-containing radical SAM protein [Deltaproteobacteria bacterium]
MGRFLFIQDNGVNENLGVMSIAAVLRAHGHEVDLILIDEHPQNYLDLIDQYNPDLIGFSFMTGNRRWAFATAKELKQKFNKPIIFGGVHPTLFPEDIDPSYVDYICIGEGEYPVLELMNAIENGEDCSEIQNLWVKKNSSVVKNPLRDLIQDFDSLPLPYREIYYRYKFIRDLPIKRFISGIGCPYRCTFCHNPMQIELYRGKGKFVRKKSVRRVIEEIRYVQERFTLKNVHFSDDTFVLDKTWLKDFLEIYRKEIDLPFSCNIRIDRVDEAAIRDMHESGCFGISFGIESGSERIRNTILKKNLKEDDIIANSRIIKKYGIKLIITNLMGVPEETLEDAFKTIALNQQIKADYIRANVLVPYPKTEIVDYAIEKNLLPPDYSIHNFKQVLRKSLIKSPYMREFENLCALFNLTVKFPFFTPLTRRLIKLPLTRFYSLTRLWEAFENMLYFRLFNLAGFRYFFHIAKNVRRDVWR